MTESGPQLSLVAYLPAKPPALARVLADCYRLLTDGLGEAFTPSLQDQVHATLVGLERAPGSRRDNANLARLRARRCAMDIPGYLAALRGDPGLPLTIRLGGFARGALPFESRGASPWERTFSVQGDRAVLLGWPVVPGMEDAYPATLDGLRRRAGEFNILHAYHASPADVDNDLYLRLGRVDRERVEPRRLAEVESEVRESLARRPVTIPLTIADLCVAAYRDPTLPPASTRALPLDGQLSDDAVQALFGG